MNQLWTDYLHNDEGGGHNKPDPDLEDFPIFNPGDGWIRALDQKGGLWHAYYESNKGPTKFQVGQFFFEAITQNLQRDGSGHEPFIIDSVLGWTTGTMDPDDTRLPKTYMSPFLVDSKGTRHVVTNK